MIGTVWGALTFLNPWILAGLLFLPALWFLLRVTPPSPHLMYFPPAHILAGLTPKERTPSHTPWWILLLRLLMAALVIVALAGPVLNPGTALPGSGDIRIVMDNSWPSAQTWSLQTGDADAILKRAAREGRSIHILTTAPEPGKDTVLAQGPMTVAQAENLLRGMKPLPWAADYRAAVTAIADGARDKSILSFWLGHGLAEGDAAALARTLQNQGGLEYHHPEDAMLPLMLRPAKNNIGTELAVRVDAPHTLPGGVPATLQAVGADGRVLDSVSLAIDPEKLPVPVKLDVPDTLRSQVAMVRLSGRESAGTVLLTDDRFHNRSVGIATAVGSEDTAPLIEASYYIRRALETTAQLQDGQIEELIKANVAVIILPDVGAIPPGTLDALEKWVRRGGLLLRFAGPNMTQGEQFLTPVPLRLGGRALDGALTWEKPVKLAPFPENSPFFGLPLSDEITVKRQILAEPVAGIEEKSWAVLEDGTPLITAAPLDKGLLVMVHTTATPAWSDLAVSGVFVKILQRIVSISPGSAMQSRSNTTLQPVLTLNGRGVLEQPGAHVKPLPAAIPDNMKPDSSHPPGLYGRTGVQTVFNIGDRLSSPQAMPAMPVSIPMVAYGQGSERDIAPGLLLAALLLFALDWLVMMGMQAGWLRGGLLRPAAAAVVLVLLAAAPGTARAADVTPDMIEYANQLHLAYIRSGDLETDRIAQQGLNALSEVLNQRTSVEPAGVVAIDPEKDELAFFPFIYWPISPGAPPLSDEALQRVQYYIDHGGTILIDTRDRLSANDAGTYGLSGGRNAETLRGLLGGLNVPPLKEMARDHVLTKSFYLLSSFPGRYDGGPIWVEEQSASGRDRVSSLIIGSHDWAAAWATYNGRGTHLSGGAQQQEYAMRFGVNVVMYALTGNYKADQVHLPHILERLGQ
jgi:hypothetical protein